VPGTAQTPQLALQHTCPTLQVLIPHGTLTGIVGPPLHATGSHGTPGGLQTPQLSLQQTCPTSQVFLPHGTLTGDRDPHSSGLHGTPGAAQIPQLALQHTCPTSHTLGPHLTLSSAVNNTRTSGERSAASSDFDVRCGGWAPPLPSAQMPQGTPIATTSTSPVRRGKCMTGE
jgi:hypothetical protein